MNAHLLKRPILVLVFLLASGPIPASGLDILVADDHFAGDFDFLASEMPEHSITIKDNTDETHSPIVTVDLESLMEFDVVIFYGTGTNDEGRAITELEQDTLETYVQAGGTLICTGYDILGNPNDPRLAEVVRSATYGDSLTIAPWTASTVDHFILNGPYGDFRGQMLSPEQIDQDRLTAAIGNGAVSLGKMNGTVNDKIIFTDLESPGGSVGMWNGNRHGDDWNPARRDGDSGLAILRNWLAAVGDADGDGWFDAEDNCPEVTNADQGDSDGDGVGDACDMCAGFDDTLDVDEDGIPDECDNCPDTANEEQEDADGDTIGDACDNCPDLPNTDQEDRDFDGVGDLCESPTLDPEAPKVYCGATGPVAPLGLAVGMMLMTSANSRRRRTR
jgi:hypothetical protein